MNRSKKILISIACAVLAWLTLFSFAGVMGEEEGSIEASVDVQPIAELAITALIPLLDSDGAAGSMASIIEGQDAEGNSITVNIRDYDATLSYDEDLINVLEVRHQSPFSGTEIIENLSGSAEFYGTASEGMASPCSLAFLSVRLLGEIGETAKATLTFNSIHGTNGNLVPQAMPLPEQEFRRGDANDDGVVNIKDVVYILQYLAGVKDIGEGPGSVNPVNAASVKHDGEYDVINFSDAWYLLRYLFGWRGPNREWQRGRSP